MPLFAWPNPAESAQVMADISEASAPPPPPPPPWDCRLGGGGGHRTSTGHIRRTVAAPPGLAIGSDPPAAALVPVISTTGTPGRPRPTPAGWAARRVRLCGGRAVRGDYRDPCGARCSPSPRGGQWAGAGPRRCRARQCPRSRLRARQGPCCPRPPAAGRGRFPARWPGPIRPGIRGRRRGAFCGFVVKPCGDSRLEKTAEGPAAPPRGGN